MTDCAECEIKIDILNQANSYCCKCHKTGCRSLETRCKDCGRVVNSTEIPRKSGNSGWISVKNMTPSEGQSVLVWDGSLNLDDQPNYDVCVYYSGMFISGGYYLNTITNWIPLPPLPDNCNCANCDEETRQILDETYWKQPEN